MLIIQIKNKINKILQKRSDNFKNVLQLSSSLFFVQLITYLSSPIITRIYSPNSFGIFASYTSIISIISVVSTFSYELAINFPDDDDTPLVIVWLCFILLLITSLFLFFSVSLFAFLSDIDRINNLSLNQFIFLIPIGMIINGIYSPLHYLAIRYQMFSFLSKSRIRESIFGLFVTLISFRFGVIGLILGQLSNQIVGILGLFSSLSHKLLRVLPLNNYYLKKTFGEYSNYAIFSTSGLLINAIGNNVPYLILLSIFSSKELGYLYLAEKLLRAPLALVSSSVEKVFIGEAPKYFRSGEMLKIVSITYNKLIKINILLGITLILFFPPLITTIFGSEWVSVSRIIFIISPWIITNVIVSSMSSTFEIINRPKDGLYAQLFLIILRLTPFLIINLRNDFNYLLLAYSLFSALGYLVYFLILRRSLLMTKNKII